MRITVSRVDACQGLLKRRFSIVGGQNGLSTSILEFVQQTHFKSLHSGREGDYVDSTLTSCIGAN